MFKKFWKKNQLDEMQEQKLLHIEKNGFWLLWAVLLVTIGVQLLMGHSMKQVAGETIAFFISCIYIVADCLRNGIWDRHLKADWRTNLAVSLLAGVIVSVFNTAQFMSFRGEGLSAVILCMGAFSGVLTALICFAAMSVLGGIYKRKHKKLEEES